MKIVAIIQARMTSTRLPGKVLMDIEGKPMLWHLIERLKRSKRLNGIILAIPDTKENDTLEKYAQNNNIRYFRGSEEDVLSRYYEAAKKFGVDIIVRITSDCPLIDPQIVDNIIEKHLRTGADYTSNAIKRTFPRGLDAEVFNFIVLETAHKEAKDQSDKEHVTLYIRNNSQIFNLADVMGDIDYSGMRWTVDEASDLDFVREIYKRLYRSDKIFFTNDIITILKKYPKLEDINKSVKQKDK